MEPFSYDEYRSILARLLERGYGVVDFRKALFLEKDRSFVVIRHDVDVDLSKAVKIARIENAYGIKSTFFFLVSSDFYNIFSKESSELVDMILAMGHGLALHFDFSAYESEAIAYDKLKLEREALAKRFEVDLNVISYHCWRHVPQGHKVPPTMVDATQEPFVLRIKYFADSYGTWRFGHPLLSSQFKKGKPLHLNFHPWWWGEAPVNRILALHEFVERHGSVLRKHISKNVFGF